MTWTPPTTIYFVSAAIPNGPWKIGCAGDPKKRLTKLQSLSPVRLELVLTVPGNLYDEKLIQKKLRPQRLHGEWFNHCAELDELMAYARSHRRLPAWAMADQPADSVYLRTSRVA